MYDFANLCVAFILGGLCVALPQWLPGLLAAMREDYAAYRERNAARR